MMDVKRMKRDATELQSKPDDNVMPKDIQVGIPEKFLTSSIQTNGGDSDVVSIANENQSGSRQQATNKKKANGRTKTKQQQKQSTKTKQPNKKSTALTKSKQNAKATLFGLATLKRQGNVRVIPMQNHTTVRSNFLLGPLILKVEKSYGRRRSTKSSGAIAVTATATTANQRQIKKKTATATTAEMLGRINLRIVNGAATLHSIKVQQPKQVRLYFIYNLKINKSIYLYRKEICK